MKTGILLMFAFAAEEDLKKRTIPVLWVIGFFALLFGMRFLQDRQSFAFAGLLAGALPGIFFFLICLLTKGEAGGGDALIILLTGILTGFWNMVMICFLALVMTGLFGDYNNISKTKSTNKKSRSSKVVDRTISSAASTIGRKIGNQIFKGLFK